MKINAIKLDDEILNLILDKYNRVKINTEITHPNIEISVASIIFSLIVLVGMIRVNANDVYSLFKFISFFRKIK